MPLPGPFATDFPSADNQHCSTRICFAKGFRSNVRAAACRFHLLPQVVAFRPVCIPFAAGSLRQKGANIPANKAHSRVPSPAAAPLPQPAPAHAFLCLSLLPAHVGGRRKHFRFHDTPSICGTCFRLFQSHFLFHRAPLRQTSRYSMYQRVPFRGRPRYMPSPVPPCRKPFRAGA